MERTKPGRKQAVKIQTMSSNLPLLFANSRPTTLESMTEAQLEKFVCFMTKCSFIQKDSAWRKNEILGDKPKWWPLHVPFKIPLESGFPSNFVNRKAMLKTLVCCCYTFYNCEFLLKFSSELAEMEPGSLCYVPSATGNITLIYTIQGTLLVKCRNENLTYDEEIQGGDSFQNRGFTKNVCIIDNDEVNCIDITDSLSENDDEVHFKQGNIGIKRKLNGHYKTLNHKRPFCGPRREQAKEHIEIIDLTDEPPVVAPVEQQTQADFLNAFGLVPTEDISKHHESLELCKKLVKAARRSYVVPFSTKCGQGVYINNKPAANTYHFDRVNRYCSTRDLSKMQPVPLAAESSDDDDSCKWTHVYKPGRRCQNPQRLHRGPSLKPCIVKLTRLSDADIQNIKTKIKMIQKPGREQFYMKTVCPQLRMTEGFGSELTQCRVKAENMPVLNNKLSVIQSAKVMNTTNHKNLESVSPVEKHVGLSDSETGNVTVRGNGDALHLVDEHPFTRSENNKKLTLELKCSFPSNYLNNTVKIKIKKLLTNLNYEPVNNNLKYLPRKLSLSKCLDNAIEWYTQRNCSVLKRTDCVNSQQLQENLVPVEDISFRHSMCAIIGRTNGKDIKCYCCAQGLYKFCVYDYIYKAKKAAVLEQKNYEQLKAHFIRMYFNSIQRSVE